MISEQSHKVSINPPIIVQYIIAISAGLIVGTGKVPDFIMGVAYMGFSVICVYFAFIGNYPRFFKLIPYLIYTEIYIRGNVHFVLNLYAQYVLLACFILLLLKQGTQITLRSRSFTFIALYAIIELVDALRTNEPNFARVAIVNSFLLFVVALWSASNLVTFKLLNTLMKHLKFAAIYLTGIVLAAHVGGHIDYVGHSNSESTNGLAPVQISGYLGMGSILFFLEIVNEIERRKIILNIVGFVLITCIMLLSFSRGGLYFLGAIMFIYFALNWKKSGNLAIILLLIPVGFFIYYYVTTTTNGLIQERYSQEGASGRDELVSIGFTIFKSDPIAGIGTGNFSKEIVRRHLYDVESGAHNEFIRAIAEHGILGMVTYWGFYIFMIIEIAFQRGVARQFALYFFVLFCLIIVHNGLKISLQPILLIFIISQPVASKKVKPKGHTGKIISTSTQLA